MKTKSHLEKLLFIFVAVATLVTFGAEPSQARHRGKNRSNRNPTPTLAQTPANNTTTQCNAVAAQADACNPNFQSCPDGTSTPFAGHAVFIPNLDPNISDTSGGTCTNDGFKFIFTAGPGSLVPTPGSFVEDPSTGTATLTGHIESTLVSGYGFNINVTFSGRTTTSDANFSNLCPGGPLLELDPNCYVPNGPIDPSTWHFYSSFTGTFTGTGNYAGAELSVTLSMHCFEVGTGASNKNVDPGASGWFSWTVTHQPTNGGPLNSSQNGTVGDFNFNCQPPPPPPGGCTLTQGFWKNHPDAWPVGSLLIGGVSYTESQLIDILNTPPRGDATYILIHQLIAAKLNVANGADSSSIASTITAADNYLAAHPLGSNPKGAAQTQGTSLANTLDSYNSGTTGPGACD
jgi:hypothetical protein